MEGKKHEEMSLKTQLDLGGEIKLKWEKRRNFWTEILSWQDEWKNQTAKWKIASRAVPNLLPTPGNLYFWNSQKGCQLRLMLEAPCGKCSLTHVQTGGRQKNLGCGEWRMTSGTLNIPLPGLNLQHLCFLSTAHEKIKKTGSGMSINMWIWLQ